MPGDILFETRSGLRPIQQIPLRRQHLDLRQFRPDMVLQLCVHAFACIRREHPTPIRSDALGRDDGRIK